MISLFTILLITGLTFNGIQESDPPNILWIVCEDTSPLLGCYGDRFATTPHIDRFAEESIVFEHVFSAPACSPSRSTLITGMYASSLGTDNLRSKYPIPGFIQFFPAYLREAGYYTTNNAKEDYNTIMQPGAWDESSTKATYLNRKPGQPFFAVFNLGVTHESKIHNRPGKTRHDPEQVPLPPHHPPTPEMKHDWALFYDNIEVMDQQVGKLLKELDESGLSDNTIVFFYGDNGGVLAGSKRFVNDRGLHVPLIIRFPEKYKSLAPGEPGSRSKRVIAFEDFAPTVLSLAGITVPDYMEGKAFLGEQQEPEEKYAYAFRGRIDERIDLVRSIRNRKFRYVRNYMPHKIYGEHSVYMWQAPSVGSWERAFHEGTLNAVQSAFWEPKSTEELYDASVDPHNVNNLAHDKSYSDVLQKMRQDTREIILRTRDAGFIPEAMKASISDTSTIYDFTHSSQYPLERILETAEMASSRDVCYTRELIHRLTDENPVVRYWAAMGCAIIKPAIQEAGKPLTKLLTDPEPAVRIMASEALYHLGGKDQVLPVLTEAIQTDNIHVRLQALTVLEVMGNDAQSALPAIQKMITQRETKKLKALPLWKTDHDLKIAKQLEMKLP